MKKKLATLLLFIFSCFSVLTGCNLFSTNNNAGLSSVVAKSGEIEITREQLINAYNNSGYQYTEYYGYSMQQALEQTINDLIDREYLLKHIEEEQKTNVALVLSKAEVYSIIKETWNYIDTALETIADQVRSELKQNSAGEESEETTSSSEQEYKGYSPYKTNFFLDAKGVYKKVGETSTDYIPENITENTKYEYVMNISSDDEDFKAIVWNRFISNLKSNEEIYNYPDKSENATFKRFIDKLYKSNEENAKLSKYENLYKSTFGVDFDATEGKFYVNDVTLNSMLKKYKTIYENNEEAYKLTRNFVSEKDPYYNQVASSTTRGNYFYYGNDEDLLTCLHILVKFDEKSQTEKIKEVQDDNYAYDKDLVIKALKSAEKTPAFERDIETGEVISTTPTYVSDIYKMLTDEISKISYNTTSKEYAEEVVKIFNNYIYKYNQDTGIMNAKFDYVVGTKTSGMVDSFTEVVRKLYNNGVANTNRVEVKANYKDNTTLVFPNGVGYAGAISAPFLEEASNYTGYHIVLFTGKLNSIAANSLTTQNMFEKLSEQKTSIAYNQTLFEYLYELVSQDNYSIHKKDVIDSIKIAPQYDSSNYSDLY